MKKYLLGLSIFLTAFLIINEAEANPFFFQRSQSATATTSVVYMTPGTATTTVTLDTLSDRGAISAALLVQYTGSTSAAVIDHTIEYSMNGIDWFGQDSYPGTLSIGQATIHHASTTVTHRWGAGSATASTTRRTFEYSVPTRYIRATLSVPIGADRGALYAELNAKSESR